MNRWSTWLIVVMVGLLIAMSVIGEVWWLPTGVQSASDAYPQTAWLTVPSVVWAVLVVSCWQVVFVTVMSAAIRHRPGRPTLTRAVVAWTAGPLAAVLALAILAGAVLLHHAYLSPPALLTLTGMGVVSAAGAVAVAYAYFAGPGVPQMRV